MRQYKFISLKSTKKVLVLMPPPVDPGEAPMNIKTTNTNKPGVEKVRSG